MPSNWPALTYEDWSATCDTLHAHTQVLGKLAAALAPPEPQLQHAALRLTARGLGDAPAAGARRLGGARRRARPAHPRGARRAQRRARAARRAHARPPGRRGDARAAAGRARPRRAPSRSTRRRRRCRGPSRSTRTTSTRPTTPARSPTYFAAATQAALVLAAFRAPYRGRSTPVNAWWGSFDLAVSLFSGLPADPPSDDFIMRNAMDAQEVAVGWWPGDPRYGKAAFYAYAHPAPEGFAERDALAPRPRAGTPRSASTSSTGRTSAPPTTRTPSRSSSPARPSATPAWCAGGTRRSRPARRARRRRSCDWRPSPLQDALELAQVLSVGAAHRHGHERRGEPREARRLARGCAASSGCRHRARPPTCRWSPWGTAPRRCSSRSARPGRSRETS